MVLCCLSFLVGVLCVLWALWARSSCGVCLGGVVSSVVMFGERGDVSLSGSGFLPGVASGLLVLCGRFLGGFGWVV